MSMARIAIGHAERLADLGRIQPAVDRLHERLPVPVTARLRWLETCCRTIPGVRPWVVAVATGAGDEAACLLVQRTRGGIVELTGPAAPLGREDRCSLAAVTPAAGRLLAEAVADRLSALPAPWRLRLGGLSPGDPVAATLATRLDGRLSPGPTIPTVALGRGPDAAPSVDAYLSHGIRRTQAKARRRMAADLEGRARVAFDRGPAVIARLVDEIEVVHRHRDHDAGRDSDLDRDAHRAWWRAAIAGHAGAGAVEVASLRLDGALAAYVISLLDPPAWRVLDGRHATRFGRYAPGRLLETEVLGRALADPAFDHLDWMSGVAADTLLAVNRWEPTERLSADSPSAARPLPDDQVGAGSGVRAGGATGQATGQAAGLPVRVA